MHKFIAFFCTFMVVGTLCQAQDEEYKLDPTKLPPAAQKTVRFEKDIKPIFEKSCFECHGPKRQKGDYRLDQKEIAIKGGDDEGVPPIVPGKSEKSPIVYFVSDLIEDMHMPPEKYREDRFPKLSKEQVGLLRAWIDQGAKFE